MTRQRLEYSQGRLRFLLALSVSIAAFDMRSTAQLTNTQAANIESRMNRIAQHYVQTALQIGLHHDGDYIDAYYGPAEWRPDPKHSTPPLATLDRHALTLLDELGADSTINDEMLRLRHAYLTQQLRSLRARIRMLQGERLSFDEESRALYDATAPVHDEKYFDALIATLGAALQGSGPIGERYQKFRSQFAIPNDKVDAVFQAAVAAGRDRTKAHIKLPQGESFRVEYVTGKPWSGYNWYQGNYQSLIQVNTDLPIYIDRAVDLACHEGYPGHHVYNVLLESAMVRERGWMEFSVYPLFSPQSLIAEGAANFGIDVAFPVRERLAFEKETLFPLAGLDPSRAGQYYEVQGLADQLSYAGNEAARRYLNGSIDAEAAATWLTRYALMSRAQAEQRVRFFDRYRSYVINYNVGRDMVRAYIEKQGGTAERPDLRWREFERLLSSPRLPSGLL